MGKGQSPTAEELKFIYDLFRQGYSDADILREYDRLERDGKLGNLPFRYDPRFIRQRRKEYEAARSILGMAVDQQYNPLIVKAQEEHLAKIGTMIEKWLEVFPSEYPYFSDQFDKKSWRFGLNNLPLELNGVCNDSFFKVVRGHLPFEDLWKEYADWEIMWSELVEICEKVKGDLVELKKQAETWSDIGQFGKDFEELFVDTIQDRQFLGNESDLLPALHFNIKEQWLYADCEYPDDWVDKKSYRILQAESPQDYVDKCEALVTNLLNTKDVIRIAVISKELLNKQGKLIESLQDILVRHDWIITTCQWCPGRSQ